MSDGLISKEDTGIAQGGHKTHRTRPQIDSSLFFSVFEPENGVSNELSVGTMTALPASALLLPNGCFMELVEMGVQFVEGILLDLDCLDLFRLDLIYHLDCILDRRFDRR